MIGLSFRPVPHDYKLTKTIPLKGSFMTTDPLKSAYVINEKNQVIKYDSVGNRIGFFSENKFGPLHSIDAKTPFNIMLFYKEQGTVITTDFRLNKKRMYKLTSVGIDNVAAACMSHDNYIWVYDLDDNRLKKIDNNYKVIYQSQDVLSLLGEAVIPNFMMEKDGLIYVNVPDVGIIMFDIYGTYYTSASVTDIGKKDLQSFQVLNNQILYYEQGLLNIYNVFTREPQAIRIPKTANTKDVRIEKGFLYVLNEEELQFFTLLRARK